MYHQNVVNVAIENPRLCSEYYRNAGMDENIPEWYMYVHCTKWRERVGRI